MVRLVTALLVAGGLFGVAGCNAELEKTKIEVTVSDNPKLLEVCGIDHLSVKMTVAEYIRAVESNEWRKWCPKYEVKGR